MSKIIYVVGYPKCGNTWLSRLLGDALDSPIGGKESDNRQAIADEGHNRKGEYLIKQRHITHYPDDAYKVVFITRDPRDVCISVQHYWGIHDLTKAINIVGNGLWPVPHGGGWSGFNNHWSVILTPDDWVKYEELHSDTAGSLERILVNLNIEPVNDIAQVVERQSFDARKKQLEQDGDNHPHGKLVQLKNLRAGRVGDWRNVLNCEQAKLVDKLFGWRMWHLGYEESPEWIDKLCA